MVRSDIAGEISSGVGRSADIFEGKKKKKKKKKKKGIAAAAAAVREVGGWKKQLKTANSKLPHRHSAAAAVINLSKSTQT